MSENVIHIKMLIHTASNKLSKLNCNRMWAYDYAYATLLIEKDSTLILSQFDTFFFKFQKIIN